MVNSLMYCSFGAFTLWIISQVPVRATGISPSTWVPSNAALAGAAAAGDAVAVGVTTVAVAAPEESVVARVTAMPPELAAKETVTPEIRLFDELRANTVMVAEAEPSKGTDVMFDIAVSDVGVEVVVPLPELPLPVLLPVADDLAAVRVSPPQPAKNTVQANANIANLRMIHPRSTLVGVQ